MAVQETGLELQVASPAWSPRGEQPLNTPVMMHIVNSPTLAAPVISRVTPKVKRVDSGAHHKADSRREPALKPRSTQVLCGRWAVWVRSSCTA
jgi:hypothetical protein